MTEPRCLGCRQPLDPRLRACTPCLEAYWERLAQRIDPTYDPAQLNRWEDCHRVLVRLWCWPPLELVRLVD